MNQVEKNEPNQKDMQEESMNEVINREETNNPKNKPDTIPTIDLIIPVYKPDELFHQSFERLLKQTVKPNTIRLMHTIESASTVEEIKRKEETEAFLQYAASLSTNQCRIISYPIKKSEFDHGGTRNYGASLSNADIVMFMTQDAVPADKDLIKNIRKGFQNQNIAAVYGRQLVNQKSGTIEKYTRAFNYPAESYVKSINDLDRLGIKTYFCSNVCAAYRKSVYDKLGGFVTKTIFNEDMIMAAGIIHAGYAIAYEAEAKVIHSHKYTYRQQFQRNFDLAVSQKQYSHIFQSVKSENEGIKLVKQTLQYLIDQKKVILIPDLILQSGFKYLGYKSGLLYDRMPKWLIKKLSMNPGYWN